MKSFLTITSPADDLTLLSIAEMRAAVGVADGSQDATLQRLSAQAAASIMSECNIAIGTGAEPTLKQETLTQTFYQVYRQDMILDRRHNIEITSITENAVLLDAADYMVDPESGIVTRMQDDIPTCWAAQKVIVVYKAGFEIVPSDLKQAAGDFLRAMLGESIRDPFVKGERVNIPGIEERETSYWVGSVPGQSSEGAVPDIVSGQLKRFRNFNLG
jgi:hypothetical protein